jgi:hypothetical protein
MLICGATNKMKYESAVTTYNLSRNHHNGNGLPCHKPEKPKECQIFPLISGELYTDVCFT